MKIEALKQAQLGKLEYFLKTEKVDSMLLRTFRNNRSVIISSDTAGEILGVACYSRNELHPFTLVEDVYVRVGRRRKGIGTSLHKSLRYLFPSGENDFSIDMGCYENEEEKRRFIESLCPNTKITGTSVLSFPEEFHLMTSNENYVCLREYYQKGGATLDVKKFHCRIYDRDHEPVWPLARDKEIREDYFLEGDQDLGFVLIDKDNEICGVSLCYRDFSKRLNIDEPVTCIHGYAEAPTVEEEFQRIIGLYSKQISECRSLGSKVYFEFDSFEPSYDLMCEWIPSFWKRLYRYQFKLR
ncbi:MAG: GNAT family N-acetyltransferase [Halobacteriovoraceae bacterium]|nr:GNAT family N-acetyltransferase [Halobacteriovoraceae bacterium]